MTNYAPHWFDSAGLMFAIIIVVGIASFVVASAVSDIARAISWRAYYEARPINPQPPLIKTYAEEESDDEDGDDDA